ncbi:MAG: hypothetical protein K2X27_15935 [Candidatus Obscuribacterales bacterium]|nr:hypothetical protein [Candidatus Obscuribacterales bacterium]
MVRGNVVLLNVSGGELSPELYARIDLPIYQRGMERVQNYLVLPQGGLLYRNAFQHVHNTRSLATGRLISFTFSEQDTYVIELTDKKMRFYRNFGAILDTATKSISAITKAAQAKITSNSHGYSNGKEIYLSGIVGMKELNNQFFLVANVTANDFTLQDIYGNDVDSSQFNSYSSGGTIATIYSIDTPFAAAHLKDLHIKQSADTIYITHQKYAPYKLTRTDHTAWSISTFTRTADPFNQRVINAITKANPGVITTTANHGFSVGDEVYLDSIAGMTQLNTNRYLVNTTPTATTLTLKDATTGTPIDTSSFTTYTSAGIIIQTKYCPKTLAFTDTRLGYGNWTANPAGLAFSRAPDSSTGASRFDDFTTGSNATDTVLTSLSPVFDKVDSIQWIGNVNRQIVVGCLSSIRRVHGDTVDDPISPSSINSRPINSIGSAAIQPYSSGQSIFYIDGTGRRVNTFLFAFQTNDYATVNQNLAAKQLGDGGKFTALAQQRGDSGLLWVLRDDGVLVGLTFNELESIFGWHRHYIGGSSSFNGVVQGRAKVLSITIEPRLNDESVLWAIIERTVAGKTYRSVEYLNAPVKFVEEDDFFSGSGFENQAFDNTKYAAALFEQVKDSVHVDSAITYDGSALSSTITMTPSATTGDSITITASASFFDSSMVGRQIWKAYDTLGNGGGRAEITGVVSATQAACKVLKNFDNSTVIPAGSWYLTANKVYGMKHLAGETVDVQVDGAPGGKAVVANDGSVSLDGESSKVHIGFAYLGMATTMNLDIAGPRGSSEAKIRKIRQVLPRFHNTVGAKIGTTLWNAEDVTFKTIDDLTDRPTPLFRGVQGIRPSDSWTRQKKQVVVLQDIPSPQMLLSLDIMLESEDE